MPPGKQVITDIATELGVDPAFVEKDWCAVQVLAAIANIEHEEIAPVFCGGTCLTKAYGLLKRFSEDLDFRGHYRQGGAPPAKSWRTFRESVLVALEAVPGINLDRKSVDSNSRGFKVPLEYQRSFDMPGGLRPHLQVEFSKTRPRSEIETHAVHSFVTEFSNAEPDAGILCLSPLETAADKLCALTWRTLRRDRTKESDDPTFIRHLHDLSALYSLIPSDRETFSELARDAFDGDMALKNRRMEMNLPEAAMAAHATLSSDVEYENEYERYVLNMSYANADERDGFKTALSRLEELVTFLE